MHRTEPEYLTIVLTDAPPVRIEPARWPVIASAKRIVENSGWSLVVRRHEDCRAIVYGQEHCGWAENRDDPDNPVEISSQAGKLLGRPESMEEQAFLIARTIVEVGKSLGFSDDFITECIQSMAPEELD